MPGGRVRVEALTFFRFVAAAIVVVFHFGRDATGLSGVLVAGPQMVTFFFVLSGFVMGLSYFDRGDFDRHRYWLARIARILPVYALGLALMLLSIFLRGEAVDAKALLLNLTLLQSWSPPYPTSINPPGWSLSVEAFFYWLFPFVLLAIRRYRVSAGKALALSMVLWGMTQAILIAAFNSGPDAGLPRFAHDLIYYFPLSHLCSFLLGVSGGIWLLRRRVSIDNTIHSTLFVTGALSLVVMAINGQPRLGALLGFDIPFRSSFYAPLFLLLIVAVAACRSTLSRALRARPLVLLGGASYSVYILQAPLELLYADYLSDAFGLSPAMDFGAYFVLLIVISMVCFLAFEKPANRWIRYTLPDWLRRRRAMACAGEP